MKLMPAQILPPEYQLNGVDSGRDPNVLNRMDNPPVKGLLGVYGLGLGKEPIDLLKFQRGLFRDDPGDFSL